MNSIFLLRARAAWRMLHQRIVWCRRAAGKSAIQSKCGWDQISNSQSTGKSNVCHCSAHSSQKPTLVREKEVNVEANFCKSTLPSLLSRHNVAKVLKSSTEAM